ncbi:MAG: cell division protein FtsZ [Flavobacteriaceae bacterium]|nr:cell division protein FtsZ [Flavobacteriaceae bacterium]
MNDSIFDPIAFEMPKNQYNAIKVIGVGGGGSNAVNYMFQQEISGVDFVICNTDAQALENSPIPVKIQLGADLTEGMGAGANPEIGAKAAQESYNELREVLSTNTKMVFITAGMGGGTGTGAAPIIAKIAKELSLLTVGIVTMPFEFEGKSRISQAQKGIEKLRENVDSLIVINNNKLREVYGNLGYKSGFSKADEVLSTAAKGIAEVITHHYKQNIDLNDAKTVLSNSGTAIMGSASAEGTDRARNAISKALDSPLLNDNKITGAKNVLLLIVSGTHEVTFDEIGEINDHVRAEAGNDVNIIMGIGDDEHIGDAIAVTIVATGFSSGQQHQITNTEVKKIVHSLEDNQELLFDFSEGKTLSKTELPYIIEDDRDDIVEDSIVIHNLEEEEVVPEKVLYDFDFIPTTEAIQNIDVIFESIQAEMEEDDFFISFVEEKVPVKKEPLKQMELSFDFPLEKEEPIVQTTAEIKEIRVQDALLYHKAAEQEITYNLSDYEDVPAKQVVMVAKTQKVEDLELQFELKTQVMVQEPEAKSDFDLGDDSETLSPLNTSISEFKKTTEMRKNSMKQYNYSFHKGNQNIDEYENIPAYKRMNVELDDNPSSSEPVRSRTSVDFDENGIKLRTNNSFLHDNVD